ncbi:MAG: hypothetical protein RLZZ157_78 [Pseudomonadota bacterium]|jgi:hypothetical protein
MSEARKRQAALMSDARWSDRACLTGRRIVTRNWKPVLKDRIYDGPPVTVHGPKGLLREYRASALAVMAWAGVDGFDHGVWLLPPPRHLSQPWRTLAYHLAVVHLGARKACVAKAAQVSERAINWACWRIERDRDDDAVDLALTQLEAEASIMMLRCLHCDVVLGVPIPVYPEDENGPPWLDGLDAQMRAALAEPPAA